ncbi:MAG: hypothetical protein RL095_726 [Verrucomicrobiota bacterium]
MDHSAQPSLESSFPQDVAIIKKQLSHEDASLAEWICDLNQNQLPDSRLCVYTASSHCQYLYRKIKTEALAWRTLVLDMSSTAKYAVEYSFDNFINERTLRGSDYQQYSHLMSLGMFKFDDFMAKYIYKNQNKFDDQDWSFLVSSGLCHKIKKMSTVIARRIYENNPDILVEILKSKHKKRNPKPWGEFIQLNEVMSLIKTCPGLEEVEKLVSGTELGGEVQGENAFVPLSNDACARYGDFIQRFGRRLPDSRGTLYLLKHPLQESDVKTLHHYIETGDILACSQAFLDRLHNENDFAKSIYELIGANKWLSIMAFDLIHKPSHFVGIGAQAFKAFSKFMDKNGDSPYTGFISYLIKLRDDKLMRFLVSELAQSHDFWSRESQALLSSKLAYERHLAVKTLRARGEPISAFAEILKTEKSIPVRREILEVLLPHWRATGQGIERRQLTEWASTASLKSLPPWLKIEALPPLRLKDGSPMTAEEILHLISCQASMDGAELNPEAALWLELIDRTQSRAFAEVFLDAYLAKPDPKIRYALVLGCALGDDSFLPRLVAPLAAWAKGNRGRQAMLNLEAMALIGTPLALMKLEEVAHEFRSKYPYIGVAAKEAMQAVAEARGVSVDELGDSIIPWLGFEPGQPQIHGTCEVRIGADGKWQYWVGGKKKAAAPAEIKGVMKTLSPQLRAVIKAQKIRHNRMLVQERRWSPAAWGELYLKNPVLGPFLLSQIWGLWDEDGKLTASFRGDGEGGLIKADESSFVLPDHGSIGLIHPLHLDGDGHHDWKEHLVAARLTALVPQLERPLRLMRDDEASLTEGLWCDQAVAAVGSVRSKAERFGWIKQQDGSSIYAYRKVFPRAGLYADLGVNFEVYAEFTDTTTLDRLSFHRVDGGAALPFGQVPPIVFSEAVSDALLIAGKTVEEEEED